MIMQGKVVDHGRFSGAYVTKKIKTNLWTNIEKHQPEDICVDSIISEISKIQRRGVIHLPKSAESIKHPKRNKN